MTTYNTQKNNRQKWIDEIKEITGETDDINTIQFCISYTLQSLKHDKNEVYNKFKWKNNEEELQLDKSFTTVETGELNQWWIWHDGKALSTYEVCHILLEQKQLITDKTNENKKLSEENLILQQENDDLCEELMELDSFKKLAKEKGWIE